MLKIKKRPILPFYSILIHCALAICAVYSSDFSKIWAFFVLLIGLHQIVKNSNKNHEAVLWSAYMAGLEVVLRGTGGSLIWELGKYATILFLTVGSVVDRRYSYRPPTWIFTSALLLVPGVFMSFIWSDRIIEDISFNISGITCLLVSTYYFATKAVTLETLNRLFGYFLLPVISLAFVLFYKTPDLSIINFNTKANFATSGGFGPNQVASILGAGWLMVLVLMNKKEKITNNIIITYALFGFLLFRSLLTFSRGGNFAAVLAYIVFVYIYFKAKNKTFISASYFRNVAIFTVLSFFIVEALNNITGGMFENRFMGRNSIGLQKEDITAGRVELLEEEYTLFQENPMGVGVGGSMHFRTIKFANPLASHNEFGRLLSEHGIFGIIIMLLLLIKPLQYIRQQRNVDIKALCALFFVISVSTAMHSAFRLAMPAFFYGLSFIRIDER